MLNKIFLKYRYDYTNTGNRYSASYFYNLNFPDYTDDVKLKDLEIPDSSYNWMKRFAIVEFTTTAQADLEYDLVNALKSNHVRVLTVVEAKAFIDSETSLTKLSEGVYEISPASEDWIEWPVAQKTLTIS